MEIPFFLFVVVVFFLWSQLRLNQLSDRLNSAERRIAELLERLHVPVTSRVEAPMERQPEVKPPPLPMPIPVLVSASLSAPQAAPLPLPPIALPTKPLPLAEPIAVQESGSLEVTIGQSWLSKLGVISLLIALSLLLINTIASHGPWGKVITAYGVSLALLASGVWFERGSRPKPLAWSLIGGGWAGIYFTTYAIHGLEPVKLIESGTVAMMLLLAVALLMVLHSLRYESQTVTAMAFCAAFAAFEVAPLDLFNSLASIPLLLFLLFIAWKKHWQTLALSGIVFAYLAASLNFHGTDSIRYAYEWGQPVLWVYWLVIEAYDFLRYDSRQPIFPINASGLLAATLTTSSWSAGMQPNHFVELAAVAFLVSAILRFTKQKQDPQELEHLSPGGFTASMILSAVLASLAIGWHFEGVRRVFAWTLHAQLIVLAGWQLRNRFLTVLGGLLFLPPAAQLIDQRLPTPMAALFAGLLYANRFVLKLWMPFSYAATLIVGVYLYHETAFDFRPLAFTIVAATFAAIGQKLVRQELLIQSAALGMFSLVLLMVETPGTQYWITLGLPTAIYATAAWVARNHAIPRQAATSAANLFCGYFIYRVVPQPWIAVGWSVQMLVLWTFGVRADLLIPRLQCIPLAALVVVYLMDHYHQKLVRIVVICCFFAVGLLRPYLRDLYTQAMRPAALVIAIGMLTALVTDSVLAQNLTIAWALEAAGLILLGIPVADRVVRFAGLFVFALCLGRVLTVDLPARESTGRIFTFLGLGLLLLTVSWAYTQFGGKIKAYLKESETES